MQSAWDESAKYKYSEHSTIHNPQEIGADGNIHTWTLELNGQYFRVTREVWDAYHKDNAALREAGEKMAEIYTHLPKELRNEPNVYYQILLSGKEATELMAALAKWEAANK